MHLEGNLEETIFISGNARSSQFNDIIAAACTQVQSGVGSTAAIFLISITFDGIGVYAINFKITTLSWVVQIQNNNFVIIAFCL